MARTGRPPIPISLDKLDGMLMYGASCLECANEFDCSEETIVRFVKETQGMNFEDYRAKRSCGVKLRLRQKQIQMALDGDRVMCVWLGKNMLGQKDTQTVETTGEPTKLIIDLSGNGPKTE